jgi:molybdate transport system substrate-binding protein
MPLVFAVLSALILAPATSQSRPAVLVSAALSLSEVLSECGKAFEAKTGQPVTFNFGPSNALARQIVNGAPVDLFISADELQVDFAADRGALRPEPPTPIASNRLVIITRTGGGATWADARALASPRIRRIALGDPSAVPAGVYARTWLERIGLWSQIQDKLIPSHSVRAALAAVASGAAQAAIVYRTDARTSAKVTIAYEVSGDAAPAIAYPAAVPRQARNLDAAHEFLRFLRSPEGQSILAARGFLPPPAR